MYAHVRMFLCSMLVSLCFYAHASLLLFPKYFRCSCLYVSMLVPIYFYTRTYSMPASLCLYASVHLFLYSNFFYAHFYMFSCSNILYDSLFLCFCPYYTRVCIFRCLLWLVWQCDLYGSIRFDVQILWHAFYEPLDSKFKFPHPKLLYAILCVNVQISMTC